VPFQWISDDIGVKTQVNTNRRHRNRQQQSDLWAVWILWMDLDLAQEKPVLVRLVIDKT
jgi:hypothetical protein